MAKDKQAELTDKLEQLKAKPLPENIQKSIAEKQKHITKPLLK